MQRIAVIGAGAAGLCAARLLSAEKNFETVVFESTNHVGGTWFYIDETKSDKNGLVIHSSMYKNLRTNLPKQVMAFPGYKFNDDLPSFLPHKDVLKYLQDFSMHFDIHKLIKFNTLVENVQVISKDDCSETQFPKFNITYLNLSTKKQTSEEFDGVMVCNGHYFKPHIPHFPGKEMFQGKVLHSHEYRIPEDFSGMDVVVLGARSSGTDIAIEISKVAKSVILSHKNSVLAPPFPDNVLQKVCVARFGKNEVQFADGTTHNCDAFVFCTGYEYSFPFFKTDKIVTTNGGRICPLFKHLIHINYPNLSFIGICQTICPFPQFHCQVRFAIQVLNGKMKLPSTEEMLADEQADYEKRLQEGLPHRAAHLLGPKQWEYNNDLSDLCGEPRIPDNVRLLYDLCHQRRSYNRLLYREDEFALSESGQYYCTNLDAS
uniref:Flavin-containing monooxygenase n=1 Tax=Phallusia mammillata TaxID=59560 RepID=A0A6F9DD11_9ASCI|nr:flavin-containing monooxygenase FMO GS-OX-like 2 [Phallusia mammillata]